MGSQEIQNSENSVKQMQIASNNQIRGMGLIQWLCSLVKNPEIFVVRVNTAVIASGGFAGNAEFGQVFEGRGHGRHAEFQFLAGTGNREDRLRLQQSVNAQDRAGGFATARWPGRPNVPGRTWRSGRVPESRRPVPAPVSAAMDWARTRGHPSPPPKAVERSCRSIRASWSPLKQVLIPVERIKGLGLNL